MRNKSKLKNSQIPWEEFDRKMRKYRWIASGVIVFLLIFAACLFFLIDETSKKQVKTAKPTIALVNEDQPKAFNGTDYNFGQSFVNLVSNDSKYNWQVVSRSIADRAYSEGSIQAIIYLPQNFTQNILSLEAIDPQKAEIEYKVLNSQSELTNNLLQDKIINVLYDFNSSVVKMYYASVAGNVASAQTTMGNVVTSQDEILTTLRNDVYGPFQTTNESYSSVISMSNSLKSQNEGWIQSQNSFTESVTNMLTANSESLNSTLPGLTDYFATQKQITQVNLTNANQAIQNQADSDYNKAIELMKGFYDPENPDGPTGHYADLTSQVQEYNSSVTQVRDDITKQIDELSKIQESLLSLEGDLYSQFFAQNVSPTIDNFDFSSLETKENARIAMANLLTQSFGNKDNVTDSQYSDNISALIGQVSVNQADYVALFDRLVEEGSMTLTQRKQYEDQINILRNYATYFGIPSGSVSFSSAPAAEAVAAEQSLTKTLTVAVPAGEVYTLSFSASDVTVSLDPNQPPTGLGINAANPNAIVLDNSASVGTTETIETTDEEGNTVIQTKEIEGSSQTYTITYRVNLSDNTTGKVVFNWGNESEQYSTTDTFVAAPSAPIQTFAGAQQLGYISDVLGDISTASGLIAFLYGPPGANYTSMIGIYNFRGQAHKDSIYNRYKNIEQEYLSDLLDNDDVELFMNYGIENIEKVRESLKKLKLSIPKLEADKLILDTLSENYFTDILSNLDNWYSTTMTALNEQHEAAVNGLLQEKLWGEYSEEEKALYYDLSGGDNIYSSISSLVSSSAKQAQQTASSAQIIESNAAQFDMMVQTVTQTQASAQEVLNNTNGLLASGTSELKDSQDYYGNFGTLLANTRTNGVDSNNIFDFFAKPLAAKDITPKASITDSFDWRWLVIFIMGILLGVLGRTWIRPKPKTKEK